MAYVVLRELKVAGLREWNIVACGPTVEEARINASAQLDNRPATCHEMPLYPLCHNGVYAAPCSSELLARLEKAGRFMHEESYCVMADGLHVTVDEFEAYQ